MHRRIAPVPLFTTALALSGCTAESEAEVTETSAEAPPTVSLDVVADSLDVPREVFELNDGTLLVSDQTGRIVVIEDGVVREEPLLDLSENVLKPNADRLELGLAGVELAPDFAETGVLYTFTTEEPEGEGERLNRITRWQAKVSELTVDPSSAVVLLEHASLSLDHVGGELEFDDEGHVFAAFGASGSQQDAQDPETLEGKIIRIMPNGTDYEIPADNPFADSGGAPEIYSMGYRNPWWLDWDSQQGLVVAEAMWTNKYQQLSVPEPGDNAGFPLVGRAIDNCWDEHGALDPSCESVEGTSIAPPVLEYGPGVGSIISGVVVLEGTTVEGLEGVLVSDWQGSLLLAQPGEAPWSWSELPDVEETGHRLVWGMQQAGVSVYVMVTSERMTAGVLYQLAGASE